MEQETFKYYIVFVGRPSIINGVAPSSLWGSGEVVLDKPLDYDKIKSLAATIARDKSYQDITIVNWKRLG